MSTYNQIAWLPLAGGLTILGLIGSWFAWRRRGAAAGLRGVAWSLLPLAAYLTGAILMLWKIGVAIGDFATSFVFSPKVWSGVVVALVAAGLFVVSGVLRRSRGGKATGSGPEKAAADGGSGAAGKALKPAKPKGKAAADDDDLSDVADILRRHNIK